MAKKITKKPVTKKRTPVKRGEKSPAANVSGKITLPKELFGAKVNKQLLAQSVRVYLANQRVGSAKTKTRGEVEGSTRKIYRQKGTGKARHGSIRAPIFVGGGIVFGPVPRDYHLKLSKSMKRVALLSALSARKADTIINGALDTVEPKTKNVVAALAASGAHGSVLLVIPKDAPHLVRAARNIEHVDMIGAADLHPYAILTHRSIVFTKKALEESTAHFGA